MSGSIFLLMLIYRSDMNLSRVFDGSSGVVSDARMGVRGPEETRRFASDTSTMHWPVSERSLLPQLPQLIPRK